MFVDSRQQWRLWMNCVFEMVNISMRRHSTNFQPSYYKTGFKTSFYFVNSYPHLAANLPLNAVFTMKTFFLQVWHPGSSSASRANFSRHVFSYIRHFRTLSRSARKMGSKNAKNRKNRVSARYHCNSSQLRLRFGLTHQIRNVARFSANILWNFQPWLQSKNCRLILGEKTWFKAKNVILEVSTFFLEYNFFSVFRPNQYFLRVFSTLYRLRVSVFYRFFPRPPA